MSLREFLRVAFSGELVRRGNVGSAELRGKQLSGSQGMQSAPPKSQLPPRPPGMASKPGRSILAFKHLAWSLKNGRSSLEMFPCLPKEQKSPAIF